MSIIQIILILIVVGVALYLIHAVIPMPNWVRTVIDVLAALLVFILVLNALGISTGTHVNLR